MQQPNFNLKLYHSGSPGLVISSLLFILLPPHERKEKEEKYDKPVQPTYSAPKSRQRPSTEDLGVRPSFSQTSFVGETTNNLYLRSTQRESTSPRPFPALTPHIHIAVDAREREGGWRWWKELGKGWL